MAEQAKPAASPLHHLNLLIAVIAGVVSIVSGVYSIRNNFFTPKVGSVQGIVMDEAISKPLWMAPVEVTDASGAVIANINTDQEGKYSLESLHEGNYTVKVTAPLHVSTTKNVKIIPKTATTVNFDLTPEKPKTPSLPAIQQVEPVTTPQMMVSRPVPNRSVGYPVPGVHQPTSASGMVTDSSSMQSQSQMSNPYQQSSSGFPMRGHPRGFHRNPMSQDSNNSTSSSNSGSSSTNDTLGQVIGQLVQGLASKKSSQ